MTFSRELEYAIKGMAALAAEGDARPLVLLEIATRQALPLSFLSKIFQKLLRYGLVTSRRGVERGYVLSRDAGAITLKAILEAIEGPDFFSRCAFAHHRCGERSPCMIHPLWQDVRPRIAEAFERTTLQDIVQARMLPDHLSPPKKGQTGHLKIRGEIPSRGSAPRRRRAAQRSSQSIPRHEAEARGDEDEASHAGGPPPPRRLT